WGRDWWRLVEKTGVPAASNARKTLGAVEFTTKTEPTPMMFWFWTRPAINARPWCKSGRGHPLPGTREKWVAPFGSLAIPAPRDSSGSPRAHPARLARRIQLNHDEITP